jgi:hypothetical protein
MKRFPILCCLPVCLAVLFLISGCRKTIEITKKQLPPWEDHTADSVTFRVFVQTNLGILVYGQYVNLALSKDSLNRSILVRISMTNGAGVARFPQLYPGTYYFNCFSATSTGFGYGWAKTSLFPQQIKDTLLIVQ